MDLRSFSIAHQRLHKGPEASRYHRLDAPQGSGLDPEEYRGWRITYQQRNVGVTVPRRQYSVVLRELSTGERVYLSGYASPESARHAARHRIDLG